MFQPFHDVVSNVSNTIHEHAKKLGLPVIGVMPAYFPMELIHAAGAYPVQLWGNNLPLGKSDAYLQSYCCSVARSILELELIGGADMVQAYAFTSLCDTLINLREIFRRVFPKPTVELSMPMTQTEEARQTYLKSVIQGVVKGLEKITGQEITPESLAEAANLYGRIRALQRQLYEIRRNKPGLMNNLDFYRAIKAGFFLPAAVYHHMLEDLIEGLEKIPASVSNRPKLLLSGLVFDPIAIHGILDDLDVHVIDDDFANGWRTVSKKDLDVGNLVEGVTE
ncbi:MAG: 2-hydroxyacyl-CoA dehydratase, partial [Deltaproteobacteria bacterium]|nr:2-hydroxyacyl-CoA dehydratase [Deltaproteobacteria bacterium]